MINKLANALEGKSEGIQKAKVRPNYKGELYAWAEVKDGFKLSLKDGQFELIQREGDKFKITAVLGGKKYAGIKDSIEQAFRTLDGLLYQKTDLWTKINCSRILAEFKGDLDFEETCEIKCEGKAEEVLVDTGVGNVSKPDTSDSGL